MNQSINIRTAKNIGSKIADQLNDIGIHTLAELYEKTPSQAFLEIKKLRPQETIPVCYYLYSFQGALLDVKWTDLPNEMKEKLRKQVS